MDKLRDIKGRRLEYKDNDVIFPEGSSGNEVYLILRGKAEVSRCIAGRKEVFAILKAGDFFGEMAALRDNVRSMTVTAVGDLCLNELSLDEMIEYLRRDPARLKDAFRIIAHRLDRSNARINEMILSRIKEEDYWDQDTTDKLNILVVDDHPNIRKTLKDLLSHSYNTFTAPDGASAMQIMEQHDISIVMADYRMPNMHGGQLLESIKNMYPDTIRIMLSDWFDQEKLMQAIKEVQIHDVIAKPWRSGEVEFTLARWSAQYRKLRHMRVSANSCSIFQQKLESANEVIQQMIDELREVDLDKERHGSFWNFLRKRSKKHFVGYALHNPSS
jgi:CRP-like cAMP-binding protein